MRQKNYDTLVQWKNARDGKTAIPMDDARRVGKSFISEKFARPGTDTSSTRRTFRWGGGGTVYLPRYMAMFL